MADFELPTSTHISHEHTPPEVEQLCLLLETAVEVVPDVAPLLTLGAVTGMRRGELVTVRRSRLHPGEGQLTVDAATDGKLRRSLTWDHGKEMAAHARFSVATGVPVYVCDLRSPWQRGSNETPTDCYASTSPNAATWPPFSPHDLDTVAAELNGRPRQTLGWMTPSQTLDHEPPRVL
jgi:integrase